MNIKNIMCKFKIMTPCSFNNAAYLVVCEGWHVS